MSLMEKSCAPRKILKEIKKLNQNVRLIYQTNNIGELIMGDQATNGAVQRNNLLRKMKIGR